MPTPLLLAYDAECSLCMKRAEWIRARDAHGLLVLFPLQHPELARMAPELAGRTLHGELHGLDLGTRQVLTGEALLPALLRRMPFPWFFLAFPLRWRVLARLAGRFLLKREKRRFRRQIR